MIRIIVALSFGLLLAACGADGDPITPVSSADYSPSTPIMVETGLIRLG